MAEPPLSVDAAALDAAIQAAMCAFGVPGAAVAVVHRDEVVYLQAFGVREIGSDQPVTVDTLFAIGSTTKAFTTTAMAMLVDEGRMAWDDPVRKHLEFFRLADPLADQQVTLRDLVCHRTGLSRHDQLWYGSPWSREEILRKVAHVKPSASFRSVWQYQNIMYLAAGEAMGRAAGSTWEGVLQERLLAPLGMSVANFSVTVAQSAPDHASPHRKKDGRLEVIPWRNLDNIGPAGSINAGVRDLCRWLRFQVGDGSFEGRRLLSAEQLAETKTPQIVLRRDETLRAQTPEANLICYGLGWILEDYRGEFVVSHGGGIDGFRASIGLVPRAGLGFVILTNLGGTSMPEALHNTLIDQLLGLPKRDWNSYFTGLAEKSKADKEARLKERAEKRHRDTHPSRELAAYTGAYEEPAYGTAHVSLESGHLTLQWSSYQRPLEHFHHDTFQIPDEPLENEIVQFALDSEGSVASMRFLEVEFKKART